MALKSFRDRDPVAVGIVSLIVAVVLVGGTFLVGTQGVLQNRYVVTGVFADTGGMRTGQDVRVAGVRVGEVTDVSPDFSRGNVVITWEVDEGIELSRDVRAEIKMENVLGGRYLRLSGPVTAPYLGSVPAHRRRVPLERTRTPTSINDVLGDSAQAIGRLDTASINRLLDRLDGIGTGDRGRLSRSLRNLGALAEAVDENNPEIRELLDNGDRVIKLASAKDQELARLLDSAQVMLNELKLRRQQLSTFLGRGHATVKSLNTLIEEHQRELIAVMNDLGATTAALRPYSGKLNDVLSFAGPTLTGFADLGGRGPWLDTIATGLGPLSPQDLAALASLQDVPGGGR